MKFSSMSTASMFTPMYSVEPCCTLGIKSTSRQGRGRLPSRLTTWLKERRDWDQTGHAEESSWRSVFYLWNSWVPSSPSVWIMRQCLRMAASLLNSAASSFRQHGKTHILDFQGSVRNRNCFHSKNQKAVISITSNKTTGITECRYRRAKSDETFLYLINAASAFGKRDVEEDFQNFHG